MGSSKFIAKLGAKSASTESSSMARKGNSTPEGVLSWEEVSGALAFIKNPLGSNMLRAKWALDKNALDVLMLGLLKILQDEARKKKWATDKHAFVLEGMVIMSLRELEIAKVENGLVVPGVEKCGRCKGRGKSVHGKTLALRDCPNCYDGNIRWYWRRARDIGLHRNVFTRTWKNPYMWLLDVIRTAISEADRAVVLQLKRKE